MHPKQGTPPETSSLAQSWRQLAPPALGIVALMLFLVLGRPPSDAHGWRVVFDVGHVPLFGVSALLMLRIIRVVRGSRQPERADFLLALLAMVVLGLVAEALQFLQPGRDANIADAMQNLTGALCFIGIAAALRPRLWQSLGRDGPIAARLVLAGAVLALLLAVMPLADMAWNYAQRARAFPVVADLVADWQRPFLNIGRVELARVAAPPGWAQMAGADVAQLTFLDVPWPGFTVREPFPDWSRQGALRFQVWSELGDPVELVLRVDDGHRRRAHGDRFNGSFIVMPGMNDFTVPLETIADGPRERQLDLADISQFVLLSRRPSEPFELYFSHFWLE